MNRHEIEGQFLPAEIECLFLVYQQNKSYTIGFIKFAEVHGGNWEGF